jgi:hypothetical protein
MINMDSINDLRVAIARMEGKLDVLLDSGTDHEARLRKLERLVWTASGAAAVLGAVTGSLASHVTI